MLNKEIEKKNEEKNIFIDMYNDFNKFIKKILKPFVCRALENSLESMKLENLKALFTTKEKFFYFVSLPLSAFIIYKLDSKTDLNNKFYALTFFGYFLYKGVYLEFFPDLKSKKDTLNKDVAIEDKLMTILDNYNLKPIFIGKSENDFIIILKVKIGVDIKSVTNKYYDIASRMKLNKNELNINIVKDVFHFEIRKEIQPTYLFHEYLKKNIRNKKQELPFVLGINQNTGQLVVEDLVSMQSMLITGIPKSGKSCFINGLVQSSMFFNNNCIFILVDFKGNELNQYIGFKNCIFIKKYEQLKEILKVLIKEIEWRYEKLDTCKTLKDFNELHNEELPYICIIVDEVAEIKFGSNLSDEINDSLVRVGNVGRACGAYYIGLTQRPSHTQLVTDSRSAFTTTITCRVANKKDCSFTDSPGAEKLRVGEFLVNSFDYNLEKFKGLLIDDKKHNYIFEELKEKLKGGVKNNVIQLKKNK